MRNNINNRAHWISMRQSILAEIIAGKPSNDWTPQKIADAMREHELIKEVQPKYSITTAKKDWYALSSELAHNRKELVDIYLQQQLEITEEMLEDLIGEWNSLLAEEVEYYEDAPPPLVQRAAKIRSLNALGQAMERILKRQANLIPIEVPKRLEIDERRINLDIFLEAKTRQQKRIQETIIDGDYEETG